MYSRKSAFGAPHSYYSPRQQYGTPARFGPRLCNSCQAPLSCVQLAYCDRCCFCKCCKSKKLSREELLAASDQVALPLSATGALAYDEDPDLDEQPSMGLELDKLYDEAQQSGEDLDQAIADLEKSQASLSDAIKKTKLKRNNAMLGPDLKAATDEISSKKQKIGDFFAIPPVLKLDPESVKVELKKTRGKRLAKAKATTSD